MKSLTCSKLLALATPVALILSSPSAFAGGAMAARQDAAPIAMTATAPAPAPTKVLHKLASLAAVLRVIGAIAATAPSRPMMDADGCPLPGNVGKGGGRRCSVHEPSITAAADDADAAGGHRR